MKRTLIVTVVIGFAGFGLIAFIGYVVGDTAEPFCEIELESNTKDLLLKMTSLEPNGTIVVDSVHLQPKEKFVIGLCSNCPAIDTLALYYYAIELFVANTEVGKFRRQEQLSYLKSKARFGCATYMVP